MTGPAAGSGYGQLLEIVAARHRWLTDGTDDPPVSAALAEAAAIAQILTAIGAATVPDLEELAIAGAPPHRLEWVLLPYLGGDAAMTAAVLAGWREAGIDDAGRPATAPAHGWATASWDGQSPTDMCLVHATRHASAARAVGLTLPVARAWAAGGVIRLPGDWPKTVADRAVATQQTRRRLLAWAEAVPRDEAPLWCAAGYSPYEARELWPLPLDDLQIMGALRRLEGLT